jgi:hypothetical protein
MKERLENMLKKLELFLNLPQLVLPQELKNYLEVLVAKF